jgi:hypothetical protein
MALELASGPDLAIGGTLEGEIEAFIALKLARNEIQSILCRKQKAYAEAICPLGRTANGYPGAWVRPSVEAPSPHDRSLPAAAA